MGFWSSTSTDEMLNIAIKHNGNMGIFMVAPASDMGDCGAGEVAFGAGRIRRLAGRQAVH